MKLKLITLALTIMGSIAHAQNYVDTIYVESFDEKSRDFIVSAATNLTTRTDDRTYKKIVIRPNWNLVIFYPKKGPKEEYLIISKVGEYNGGIGYFLTDNGKNTYYFAYGKEKDYYYATFKGYKTITFILKEK